ncbi:MAG: outer membrane protein transport protein [Thermoanaerobaculia bacterium]|nr:outer membrane protein transport protein [Thermoanaerobaculia bacterium]
MKFATHRALLCLAALLLVVPTAPVLAQSTAEAFGAFQLNLDTPGAKSLGMAGATLATIDDPSAAVVNPAGLVGIENNDIVVEFRQNRPENLFSVAGLVTPGQGAAIKGIEDQKSTNFSFAAYTRGFAKGAVSVYYDTPIAFSAGPSGLGPVVNNVPTMPHTGLVNIDVESIGVAGAFKINDEFSIGVGVAMQDLTLDGTNSRFARETPFPPDPYRPGLEVSRQSIVGDDDDVVFNAGFVWKSERVSVGGAYRQGSEFDTVAVNRAGQGTATPGVELGRGTGSFALPDTYGLGASFFVTKKFLVAVQWNHQTWGDLSENLADPFGVPAVVLANLKNDDIDTYHLGMGWIQDHPRFPVEIWWGAWESEGRRVAWNPAAAGPAIAAPQSLPLQAHFLAADDETHFSAGVGMTFDWFRFGFSGDISDEADTIVGSVGFNF